MYDTNIEFQIISFLAYGVLLGGISKHVLFVIFFCIVYEFYVFHISRFYPPEVKTLDRILLNLIFIFGWVVGRFLMLNESGLEEVVDLFNETVPQNTNYIDTNFSDDESIFNQ